MDSFVLGKVSYSWRSAELGGQRAIVCGRLVLVQAVGNHADEKTAAVAAARKAALSLGISYR